MFPIKKHRLLIYLKYISVPISLVLIYSLDFRNIGVLINTLGAILNASVIISNKGLMPINLEAVRISFGLSNMEQARVKAEELCSASGRHTIMDNTTNLNFLGDNYGITIASIGDYLLEIGVILVYLHSLLLIAYYVILYAVTVLI